MVNRISSAKGVLSLLRETDSSILLFALRRVLELMDTFWCEISADLPVLEELCTSESLPQEARDMAALVVSQVFFHLDDYDQSVQFALAAGRVFDRVEQSLYTNTILSRCIDQYVVYQESPTESRKPLDPRLETLFEAMTNAWSVGDLSTAQVKELVGFTIRARRLDFLERVLTQHLKQTHTTEVLTFTFNAATTLLSDIHFRHKILRVLVNLYSSGQAEANYIALVQCLVQLGDVAATAQLLIKLVRTDKDNMMALQLAFVLFDNGNQQFLSELAAQLVEGFGLPPVGPIPSEDARIETVADPDSGSSGNADGTATVEPKPPAAPEGPLDVGKMGIEEKVLAVLTGAVTTNLYLKFLYARCEADMFIIYNMKRFGSQKLLMLNATIVANALMYCGTTIDGFLRDNIAWLRRADYWAKFTATASIGVIHRGHVEKAMKVLESYLPKSRVPQLAYQEAGALYALGLIHAPLGASQDRSTIHYIRDNLSKFSSNEQMVHGASLGLGLAAVGLQDEELFDLLFTCVTSSDAVGGEGAAVGIGMLLMGSSNEEAVQSLRNMAGDENQKEKIIRGCCMAIALINLGREDAALPLADEMLESGDPWVRLGGCFVLGLAYAGVESTTAIERLLNTTVKDTSDDVRRNAVMMIGFLTFRNPALCLSFTRILLDSYNAHVRYGVALALGIAAAGSGNPEIIDVLWELRRDLSDFVRQGVLIALALVMVQVSEADNPKVREFNTELRTIIADIREEVCVKYGAAIATGIIDGGGRNCTYSMKPMGKAVLGMFLFSQHWYWYPYTLMISLAMQPTCFIGLNESLEMPEYRFRSNLPAKFFAVPKSIQQEKKEKREAGTQAVVLSTTHKEEERRQKMKRSSTGAGGGASTSAAAAATAAAADKAKSAEGKEAGADNSATAAAPEEKFEILSNPCRVTQRQQFVISHDYDERYRPLKARAFGICLLRDEKPELGEQKLIASIEIIEEDAPAPQPFAYP